MLPAGSRLRHRVDFTDTFRRSRGVRGDGLLVVHLASDPAVETPEPARVGLVVPKTVGTAVVRNRVKRRLRHLLACRLDQLPPGARLVVRALPPVGQADFAAVAAALDAALARALRHPTPQAGG